MSDLISRKELLKVLRRYYANTVLHRAGLPDWGSTTNEVRAVFQTHGQVVKEIIETAPAIDAEPVRHGKWYWHEEATYNPTEPTEYNSYWACSDCGEDIADYLDHALPSSFIFLDSPDYEPTMEYCPHCSAKMDLEDDDE